MKDSKLAKDMAQGRIDVLLGLAREKVKSGKRDSGALAKRYVRIAKRISSHYRVRIPRKFGNYICKRCNSLLVPGVTARVRLSSSERCIIYKCDCGKEMRVFYK